MGKSITANLDAIIHRIHTNFTEKDTAREKAIPLCRESIRCCANAIRAAHRSEFEQSKSLLETSRQLLHEADSALSKYDDLRHSGLIHDAQKEYVEGCITLALIRDEALPEPETLEMEYAAYLRGMGEAMGEMRRHILDTVRGGDLSRCEELLFIMDDVYGALVTVDFPDALTHGLRRTTDMVRGVLEKTRGELTLIIRQRELEQKLEQHHIS